MKKFVYSLLAIAAATMAFSCVKNDEAPVKEKEAVQPETRTFYCTFAEPDTKFAVDAEGKTAWEVGDEIMIHGGEEGAERYKVTLTADDILDSGKRAKITFTINPYDRTDAGYVSKYYAQYPASLVPEGDIYYEARFTDSKDFIMAACNVDDTFVFFNLNGVISYKVSGDFDKVVFTGNNGEVVGYTGTYQARVYDKGEGAKLTNPKFGNGSGDAVTVTSVEMVPVVDGTTTNYIFLPAGSSFSGGFTFKFYKNDVLQKIAVATNAVNVATGKLLALGDITSKLKDYVAPSVSDHVSNITGATDLGATATANCYIITAPGAYKLPVVKGNSTDTAGNVFGVELVWETYNNSTAVTANSVIAQVDYDGPSNYIFFKTPDTLMPGNALIAAKDSDDKIIWSWHIWIPATTITTNTYSIYNHALMDRYLGALVAATTTSVPVESFGLHYEWGRKDPFLGAGAITGSGFAKRSGTALSVAYEMTVAQTIANPATYAVYTSSDSWGNWLSPANDANLWKDAEKTIYDPCPAGYRVPKRDSSQPMHNSDLSTVTGWSDNAAAGDNAAYFTLGDPVTVFPYGGLVCENAQYMDYNGARTFIWTSSVNSDVNPRMMDVRYGTSTHTVTTTKSARGCSIRCVAE